MSFLCPFLKLEIFWTKNLITRLINRTLDSMNSVNLNTLQNICQTIHLNHFELNPDIYILSNSKFH